MGFDFSYTFSLAFYLEIHSEQWARMRNMKVQGIQTRWKLESGVPQRKGYVLRNLHNSTYRDLLEFLLNVKLPICKMWAETPNRQRLSNS